MFLLDTVTISELRKSSPDESVLKWFNAHRDDDFYLSAITIGDIYRGIISVRKRDPAFANKLADWLQGVIHYYKDNILPVTMETALDWAVASARADNDSMDTLIAATAIQHHLTLVTRNTRHFESAGVSCVNPWLSA